MGINVTKTYSLGFALGSALAGAAGALIAPLFIIEIGMGATPLWKCFIVVLLGGMGSLPGSVLAGLFLGLMDSVLGTLVSATMASIVGFISIILILMFKPEGLMGQKLDV
jgi:branched-chain amino acid transport system permease protein